MRIKATFKTNNQKIKATFGEKVTVVPTDKAFEIALDEIIDEQEEILTLQNKYIGGEVE